MNTLDYIIKKYNLRIGRQYVVAIPNMDRGDLAMLFAELKFNVGAEIGVERGLYSEILCKTNPGLHLYSIDPWKASVTSLESMESRQNRKAMMCDTEKPRKNCLRIIVRL